MGPIAKRLPRKLARLWPRYWRPKWKLNARLIGEIFSLSLFAKAIYLSAVHPSDWAISINRRWRIFRYETGLPIAIILLAICSGIAFFGWRAAQFAAGDLWPELGGMVFDIFVILIVYEGLQHRRFRREAIQRQQDIVDDFKRWDSEEARRRISGAIRRLNRMGETAIDFAGTTLSNFAFAKEGIGSIKGSTFFDGKWGQAIGDSSVQLNDVEFDRVDLRSVKFSPFEPLQFMGEVAPRHCKITNCSFRDVSLNGVIFNGAAIVWSDKPPDEHEHAEYDEEGEPFWVPDSYGPFHHCDLTGASFVGCHFENADFRGASGLGDADFYDSTGLENAIFSDEAAKFLAMQTLERNVVRLPTVDEAFGQWNR